MRIGPIRIGNKTTALIESLTGKKASDLGSVFNVRMALDEIARKDPTTALAWARDRVKKADGI